MVNLDLVKNIFSKIKENWLVIMAIVIVLLITVDHCNYVNNYKSLQNKFNEQSDNFRKQLKELEKINETWKQSNERLKIQYEKDLESIKKEYDEKINDINKKRINAQKNIVQEAKIDPQTLTKKTTEAFGIPVSQ